MIFSQLLDWFPKYKFDQCIQRYRGDYRLRNFSCFDQLVTMIFAQLTYRESLRDIETCLRAQKTKLYHAGIRGKVSRNTLAKANENRDWRIFGDFAQILIGQAQKLYDEEDFGVDLKQVAYALDSTTIDLCLSLFPWAKFRRKKTAIKLHTLLNLRGNFPTVVIITPGKVHDVNILDELAIESGAFYIMDRGYLDFARLYAIHQSLAFFVTRTKKNSQLKRRYSHIVDKSTGLRCDQTVILKGLNSSKDYPQPLRRIKYFDAKNNKRLTFLTNNFTLPALTIAQLYKRRWRVELFFKRIKQHLRIKAFYGTSENAVKTQVWIAISVYILVAIVKKELKIEQSLYTILQILSVTLFEKKPILQVFKEPVPSKKVTNMPKQLCLSEFLTGQ
ncbi:MAG: IS4 family transposase [Candidatus Riflebacteria bacterium]|nr:IS4 family transposase [Candidatus Riflebacteria bacterium]